MAAVPLAAVRWVRRGGPPAPNALGRTALLFALVYALALLGFARVGPVVTLLLYSFAIGSLPSPRGMTLLQRALYGRAWVRRHPEAGRADARRLFVVLFSVAVLFFSAAMLARVIEIARLTKGR